MRCRTPYRAQKLALAVPSVRGSVSPCRRCNAIHELFRNDAGVGGLDEERQIFYADIACQVVNDAARAVLEETMKGYVYQSDFARKYFGQGRKEGEAIGEARGEARALLAVLDARAIKVSKVIRRRIVACDDAAQLERWVRRATTVKKAAELFDEPATCPSCKARMASLMRARPA